ncbi:MAG: hypothetical protein Q8Q14_02645 [Gemmatimonadales bacterium]|nr:hypothetical protein [Gemmatimonadales bacterium]
MAITGNFRLLDYQFTEAGVVLCHFENPNPGAGNPTDFYVGIPEPELPTNISQPQLGNTLKKYLGLSLGESHTPLNTFRNAGTIVVIP